MSLRWYDPRNPDPLPTWVVILLTVVVTLAITYLVFSDPVPQ